MTSLTSRIEALLFAARTALSPTQLIRHLQDVGPEDLELSLARLRAEYQAREGALEVRHEEGGWVLGLKAEFYGTVRPVIPVPVRDAVLATLTHIAREQPVSQSTIIRIRGQKAYNHIRDLLERGWITKNRAGNSYVLRTTKEFSKVFGVTEDPGTIRSLIEDAGFPDLSSS